MIARTESTSTMGSSSRVECGGQPPDGLPVAGVGCRLACELAHDVEQVAFLVQDRLEPFELSAAFGDVVPLGQVRVPCDDQLGGAHLTRSPS
jgi:hypothetical protein